MKKVVFVLLLACLSNAVRGNQMESIPGKVITKSQLEQMFEDIRHHTNWDLSKPMLWGYFFTHHEPKKLEEASLKLVQKGYTTVGVFQAEKDVFFLHVEQVETHNVSSLDKRNDELYLFANQENIDRYDGMDIGPLK
ncbi:ribonuclease E inhibitor RraB [Vibrio harveyi]|uniref:ribonuclease E inhibitor RraB n=1 Tax=Vibrio harveyi TaxID=669 RepID=UPI001C922860|nr:ribonuclease E inhibitor RraB [Vibrio harveyi]